MKKYLITMMCMLATSAAYSQNNIFPASGNVGIGDTDPQFMLTLKRTSTSGDGIGMFRSDNSPNLDFYSTYNGNSDVQNGGFGYGVRPSDNAWQIWERGYNLEWTTLFTVKREGNVGIGTNFPTEKLSVKGKIRAQEVKVEAANWPDFVFAKDYVLPTLLETETHIKEKGHLPGIPSASEVKANGVDLGDMNAKLLQKIEELTLYLIEQNKEITELKKEMYKSKKD